MVLVGHILISWSKEPGSGLSLQVVSEVISGLLTTRILTLSWNKLVLIVGLSLLLRP